MEKQNCSVIYADPQEIPAKYKKYNLKDCSVPVLRRQKRKKFEMEFWDERQEIEDTLGKQRVPDFTMRDITKMFTNFKCSGTIKWINKFVYNCHKNYFKNKIVSVCELRKSTIDIVAREFSAHVKPELRKHFIMACIAKDFDRYVHSNFENFHDNMLVSRIESHLRFKFDNPQEFKLAAMQYLCQRIMERGERLNRLVLFTPYRISSYGWPNKIIHEPLNYFVYEGKNFCYNGNFPTKEEFEAAFTDFAMFKDGIIIKTRIPEKKGIKRKFEPKDKKLSIEPVVKIPRARGRPKKSETNKKGKLWENKTLVKRGTKREQEQNGDLLKKQRSETKDQLPKKRGRPTKQKKLETGKEIFSSQPPNVQLHKKMSEADKENFLVKRFKHKQRDTDIETVDIFDEDSAIQSPGTFDEHTSIETSEEHICTEAFDKHTSIETSEEHISTEAFDEHTSIETSEEHTSTEASDEHTYKETPQWTLWNMFEADNMFETIAKAKEYYYSCGSKTEDTTSKQSNLSKFCQYARQHCSSNVQIIHC